MSNPLNDLNETLKKLLLDKVRSDLAISFDIPTQDWSAHVGQQPTVNLYLYDIRENRELREIYWDQSDPEQGKVTFTQRPIQINLSYLITCWIKATEQQHLVLWQVLETLFRHSPLPVDILQGDLPKLRPIRTEVAQPDSVLKNVSEFWGALNNQIRPAINLVVTLGLDLSKELTEPVVGDVTKRVVSMHLLSQLRVMVRDSQQHPLGDASVSLISKDADGIQLRATPLPAPLAGYIFESVAPGNYLLHVEVVGHPPHEESVILPLRSDPLAEPGDQVVKVSMS